ncbi:alpha/beta fold hydrolase [Streptomyces sp. NPDC090046]|uniref:alpha/beta fold hydrolase n=1 Tax=Streptomyces sp. NPDC090046 TaxID=3365928 RepID=UPI003828B669
MTDKPAIVLVHGFRGGAAHWAKVIPELHRRGFGSLHAVENPLTSLADDAERTRKMVRQIDGPVLLVGHSYGGAVITEAGDLPNVAGLVYVAAFAPDAGESPGQLSQELPPTANERRMAERMKPRKVIELDAGHASLASQPAPVAGLIEEAALALSAP